MKHNNSPLPKEPPSQKDILDNMFSLSSSFDTHRPHLSKGEKRAMLAGIIGKKRLVFGFNYALITGIAVLVLLALGSTLVAQSKPGSTLYLIKSSVNNIRGVESPEKTPQLIEKSPEASPSNLKKSDDTSKKDGSKAKRGGDSSSDNDDSRQDSDGEKENNSPSPSPSRDDDGSGGEENDNDDNSRRDRCRDALDTRERNGEDISSDAYKACDED